MQERKGVRNVAEEIAMKVIARIHTDFPEKFGIPRQSGLIEELKSTIVFEPEFRDANALRGLEEYSHLWLIWEFSEAVRDTWSPMVRPPRLGGNKRVGVFATRSPFRPNPIGLSSVKLEYVEQHPSLGPVLHLTGADGRHTDSGYQTVSAACRQSRGGTWQLYGKDERILYSG